MTRAFIARAVILSGDEDQVGSTWADGAALSAYQNQTG
jgi:hypothetical protein